MGQANFNMYELHIELSIPHEWEDVKFRGDMREIILFLSVACVRHHFRKIKVIQNFIHLAHLMRNTSHTCRYDSDGYHMIVTWHIKLYSRTYLGAFPPMTTTAALPPSTPEGFRPPLGGRFTPLMAARALSILLNATKIHDTPMMA